MDVHLPVPSIPPLWREGLMGFEVAGLMRSPTWRGQGVPAGDGRPVLLIPGYLAGDGTFAVMTRWLRSLGYRTRRAGIRANVDCSAAICDGLEQRLEQMAEATGQPVSIIGQSRGGVIARAVAVRRPDLVAGIVTLGSPVQGMLRIHPLVLGSVGVMASLGALRIPHVFTWRCLRGECCSAFREALSSPFPDEVRYLSIHSRRDGVVDWRACIDPEADETIEVSSTHCGMAVHSHVYRVVGEALPGFARSGGVPVDDDWAQAA